MHLKNSSHSVLISRALSSLSIMRERNISFPKLNFDKWKVISMEKNNKDLSHKYDYTFIVLKKC